MKKCSEVTQTLCAGCSKADPQTNKHRQEQLQYTAQLIACSVMMIQSTSCG